MGYFGNGGGHIRNGHATHEAVCKAWAEQTKSKAGFAIFADGAKIYSFGYHYLAGHIFEHAGRSYALLNERKYSVTTSGHMSTIGYHASRAGHICIPSTSMTLGADARADEAMTLANGALDYLQEHRLSADLHHESKAAGMIEKARIHAELAGRPVPGFAECCERFEVARAAYVARASRIFGKRTMGAFVHLFALESVLGEFISAGAYQVPGYDGRLERRLCAYWLCSDGRYARVTKGWRGRYGGFDVAFLAALPADLASGI